MAFVATPEQEAESARLEELFARKSRPARLEDILSRYSNIPFIRALMGATGERPTLSSAEDSGRFYVFPKAESADPLMDAIRARNFIPLDTQADVDSLMSLLEVGG